MTENAAVISTYKETSLRHGPLKASIYHERRVELGLESDRFYDLVRWGDAATVFKTLMTMVKLMENQLCFGW